MAFCGSCGAVLKPQALFCHACGVPTGQALQPEAPELEAQPPSRSGLGLPRAAAILVVAVVIGVMIAWQAGVLDKWTKSAGHPAQSDSELADISKCVGLYKAALMKESEGINLVEGALDSIARAECAAMTPEERAVYEQGGGAASTSSSDGVTATPDQVAALDFSTISHPFSGASCVFSTVAEMSDNLGGNDYGEDAIRFGIDGKLVEFEPYGSVSKEGTGFRSRHSLPIYLTIRDIVDVGKTEEEYGFPASQWLVEVTLEQGSNKRVHQIYRFCGDG